MGYKNRLRGLIVVLLGTSCVHAAEPGPNTSASPLSVYQIRPWIDAPVSVVAALGAGVPLFFEKQLIDKSEFLRREDVNRFDRSAVGNHNKAIGLASHLVVGAALVGPVIYDYADVGWTNVYAEDMVVYTQALAVQSAIANIARFGTKRPRPDAYGLAQPVNEPAEYESFYSGHTASIFAGLTAISMTYTYRHGPSVWPWVITAVTGFGQGAMRVAAGRHFYTDVLTGAAVGTIVGAAVPMLHHRQKNATWSLLPTASDDGGGLVWQKKF